MNAVYNVTFSLLKTCLNKRVHLCTICFVPTNSLNCKLGVNFYIFHRYEFQF